MLQSRRGFLVGVGSLLTSAFVAKAQAFAYATAKPLLVEQAEGQKTLYWYQASGSDAPILCLDNSPFFVPRTPTWREFIHGIGMRLYPNQIGPDNLESWRRHYDVKQHQLDLPVDPAVWKREQDLLLSSQARAHSLLAGVHLGPDVDRCYHSMGRTQQPHIQFHAEVIGGNFTRWVTASDLAALSLLQARLIDLGLPIRIGQWEGESGASGREATR